jgi:hypothetical protein
MLSPSPPPGRCSSSILMSGLAASKSFTSWFAQATVLELLSIKKVMVVGAAKPGAAKPPLSARLAAAISAGRILVAMLILSPPVFEPADRLVVDR